MPSNPVISVRQISKSYRSYAHPLDRLKLPTSPMFEALRGVGFDVQPGETVGIIGRNGSGKSTLLQIICGTMTPTTGEVMTRGRIAALLELGSGFNPEFSGRENVYLYAAVLGLSKAQIEQRYQSIIEFAGIGAHIELPLKTYSSGMVVRLAFATAIHVEPEILVVDEALSVGDVGFQQKCLSRIRHMQQQGVSILLVTHSPNTLIEYCDRGIYLKRGHMVMDGPCRDVVQQYSNDLVTEEGGSATGEVVIENSPQEVESLRLITEGMTGELSHTAALQIMSVRIMNTQNLPAVAFGHGEEVVLEVSLQIHEPIDEPCFGIQLKSVDGIVLWSVTTQQMQMPIRRLNKGESRFRWSLRANFAGNRYVMALGAGRIVDGEYRRIHRVDYAGHFEVLPRAGEGSGWLAPQARFTLAD
jgi:lipopolysaccharide transport system ATP-binding protein